MRLLCGSIWAPSTPGPSFMHVCLCCHPQLGSESLFYTSPPPPPAFLLSKFYFLIFHSLSLWINSLFLFVSLLSLFGALRKRQWWQYGFNLPSLTWRPGKPFDFSALSIFPYKRGMKYRVRKGAVTCVCNSSYEGGREWEDCRCNWRPDQAKSSQNPILTNGCTAKHK
jgi:hypothetical protein